MAGGGCTSCKDDLLNFINSYKIEFYKVQDFDSIRPQLESFINNELRERGIDSFYFIEIKKIDSFDIFVEVTPENKSQEVLQSINQAIQEKFQKPFELKVF